MCNAVNGGAPGTVIIVSPDPPSLAFRPAELHIKIYDVLGDCIFENLSALPGADGNSYYFVWDGRNKNGRWVGTGVYRGIVTVIDENGTLSKSITIGVKR